MKRPRIDGNLLYLLILALLWIGGIAYGMTGDRAAAPTLRQDCEQIGPMAHCPAQAR